MKPARLGLVLAACAVASCASAPEPAPAARHEALPNLHRLSDAVLSGGVPGGDAGFDELVRLGVRTVISVDGATPDVARAEARGLRYVHIPITYAEVTAAERAELARAVRDLPGPVYVHCHHGKHRSPAAAAAVGVALGLVTPDQGVGFMRLAGTAPCYEGLYASVSCAQVAAPIELDAAPSTFPAVRVPAGIVAAMIDVDEAVERLTAVKAAGWRVPSDHPDLVPAAEAGRLADGLRLSGEDPDARANGEEFLRRLTSSVEKATALEEAIVAGAPAATLDARYALVRTSCTDCHRTYRDRR